MARGCPFFYNKSRSARPEPEINPNQIGLSLTGGKGRLLTRLIHNERGPQEI